MTVHSGNVPPRNPALGTVWFDMASRHMFAWNGERWLPTDTPEKYKPIYISKDQLAKMKQELTDMSEELGDGN